MNQVRCRHCDFKDNPTRTKFCVRCGRPLCTQSRVGWFRGAGLLVFLLSLGAAGILLWQAGWIQARLPSLPPAAEQVIGRAGFLSPTPSPTPRPTATPVPSETPTSLPSPTWTPTSIPSHTPTAGVTATPTQTATETPTGQPTQTPTPDEVVTPDLALGTTWQRPKDGMVMVYLPGGTFQMGNSVGDSDEAPVHAVELDPFWLDRTEVTNDRYRRCVADGMCTAPRAPSGTPDGYQDPSKGEHPVVNVTWFQAQAYCSWAGGRLPTEAEWEYAARGPDRPLYPWGESFDCRRGNFDDEIERDTYTVTGGQGCDGYDWTAPVASFPDGSTWCGALDIAGNVWEWVLDWYDADYYARSPRLSPTGPSDGDFRVMRGGGWTSGEWYVRASHRNYDAPGDPNAAVGFRCMWTIAGD